MMADEHGLPDRVDLALRAAHYRGERDTALQLADQLARRLREAQARAWMQGWLAGMGDASRAYLGEQTATPNPYRSGS